MRIGIAYSKRSCKTGRRLFDRLRQDERFNNVVRIRNDNVIPSDLDVVVRWGNSTASISNQLDDMLIINTAEAVRNASNKLNMMRILRDTEGVNVSECILKGDDYSDEDVDNLRDDRGNLFIRGANMSVRYDEDFNSTDCYCAKPINKDKEYRVHVFNGKIIALYEKIPNEGEEAIIRKDANCKFSLRDHTLSNATCHSEAQAMCIKAVKALGLVFGGVDLIRDKETKTFYIAEINSSPALNTPNIERYLEAFVDYINNGEYVEEVVQEFDRLGTIKQLMREKYSELKNLSDDELKELING